VRYAQIILGLDSVKQSRKLRLEGIWLIEPSLDTDLKLFGEIIKRNVMERGIKYRYLCPARPYDQTVGALCERTGLRSAQHNTLEVRTMTCT